jgi:hypothetical protein
MTEEERVEKERLEEEARVRKAEMEYFDFKTVHQFKETLGQYGDIYVNDALLGSLTTSNTVAEIACKTKVMGLKMTDTVRKISQFFLKKYPFDIHQ